MDEAPISTTWVPDSALESRATPRGERPLFSCPASEQQADTQIMNSGRHIHSRPWVFAPPDEPRKAVLMAAAMCPWYFRFILIAYLTSYGTS
ncbi:uncharacterized protein PG986_001161 [Apiospora aurea]|uniref:Uncharacterized protein n=1 Tax=Apiospora aurea TaxID=335848 RepID=A0ABR1QW87_9PEZI